MLVTLILLTGLVHADVPQRVVLATAQEVTPKIVQPFAGEFLPDGSFLFVEMNGGERLRRVAPDGSVETLAGTGKKGFQPGTVAAAEAEFNGMHNLAITPDGLVYLADTFNHAIRVYDPKTKQVSTLAGTGQPGYAGDDDRLESARFTQPICISLSRDAKTLFIADIGNRRVRALNLATKQLRTIAGNGNKGVPKPGSVATEQPLTDPRAVCADSQGKIYILERNGHKLYRLDADGKIYPVAGTGSKGNSGDGGPALEAAMNGPKFITCDRDDSVLIVDTENHTVRKYVPGKELMLAIAGTGKAGSAGVGGPPSLLEMKRPHGVSIEPKTGALWIADSDNHRLLKIVAVE